MVLLTVTPHRQVNHARTFPHTGYLSLTPVTIQGTLRTSLGEDHEPLEAQSVEIRLRCYESDLRTHAKHNEPRTLYQVSKTLWSSGGDDTYKLLGDFKSNWRLIVPVEAHSQGALSSMTLKHWKVWWALEAVIHHKHAGSLGNRILKSYTLHLTSYIYPPPSMGLTWTNTASHVNVPLLLYTATIDSHHYGPGQQIRLDLKLQKTSMDPSLVVRKIVIELHRHVYFKTTCASRGSADSSDPSDPETPTEDVTFSNEQPAIADMLLSSWPQLASSLASSRDMFSRKSRQTARKSSADSFQSDMCTDQASSSPEMSSLSLAPPVSSKHVCSSRPTKQESMLLLSLSSNSNDVQFDKQGNYADAFGGTIPKLRTVYHWSIGETCATQSVSIKFQIAIKISVKSKYASHIELPPREVVFFPTVAEDRAAAQEQVPRVLALQAAEARLFGFKAGKPRRSASVDSESIEDKHSMFQNHDGEGSHASPEAADLDDRLAASRSRRRFVSSVQDLSSRPASPQPMAGSCSDADSPTRITTLRRGRSRITHPSPPTELELYSDPTPTDFSHFVLDPPPHTHPSHPSNLFGAFSFQNKKRLQAKKLKDIGPRSESASPATRGRSAHNTSYPSGLQLFGSDNDLLSPRRTAVSDVSPTRSFDLHPAPTEKLVSRMLGFDFLRRASKS